MFKDLHATYGAKGFTLVGIAMDDEGVDKVKPYVDELKIPYLTLIGNEDVAKAFGGIVGFPSKFLVDRDGRIVDSWVGAVPRAVCRPLAARVGAAYEEPDGLIDADARRGDAKSLDRVWAECTERAKAREQALVLVRVTPTSALWLERAFSPKSLDGVELVPISSLVRKPGTGQ